MLVFKALTCTLLPLLLGLLIGFALYMGVTLLRGNKHDVDSLDRNRDVTGRREL